MRGINLKATAELSSHANEIVSYSQFLKPWLMTKCDVVASDQYSESIAATYSCA